MPSFMRVNDALLSPGSMPLWYGSGFGMVPGFIPSESPFNKYAMESTARGALQNDTPVELPVQELTYDDNLLTGNTDVDLDYLRQLKLINDQNAFNLEQQQQYRSWLENMSNTAYQRQANDLRTAGYNPALMLSAGGASVPSSGYSESAGGSLPSSATGYNLNKNAKYLSYLNYLLNEEKFQFNKDLNISKEVRGWLSDLADIVANFIPSKNVKSKKS